MKEHSTPRYAVYDDDGIWATGHTAEEAIAAHLDTTAAYDVMREWDREAGIPPRTDEQLDLDVPGGLASDYDEFLERLAEGDVAAIMAGREVWGLPPFV